MNIVRAAKRTATALIAPTLFMGLTAYFGWNATQGDHGLKTYSLRKVQLIEAQKQLSLATAERDMWETRTAGLRDKHVDPDTLDERARAMLNLADPTDLVVPYGPGKNLF